MIPKATTAVPKLTKKNVGASRLIPPRVVETTCFMAETIDLFQLLPVDIV
jgi:hypothetical protein